MFFLWIPWSLLYQIFWMLNKNLIFWMKICFVVADEDIPINLNLFLQGDVEDPDPSGSKPFWPDPDSVTKLNHNKVFNSWYQTSFINIVIKGQTLILKYVIGRITDYTLLYTYTVPSWIRIRSGRSRSASLVQIPHFHIIFRNKFFARAHTHTHCTHHVSDWPEVDTRQSFMECMIAKYVSLLRGRNQGQHAVWLNICKSEHLFPLSRLLH